MPFNFLLCIRPFDYPWPKKIMSVVSNWSGTFFLGLKRDATDIRTFMVSGGGGVRGTAANLQYIVFFVRLKFHFGIQFIFTRLKIS